MNPDLYNEMKDGLERLDAVGKLDGQRIYLFGHCNATEQLAELVLNKGHHVEAILDNNSIKQGNDYNDIPIVAPDFMVHEDSDRSIVLIAVRFYAAMVRQLRKLGYEGRIEKLIEYDSFAEYSLTDETVCLKLERIERGRKLLKKYCINEPGRLNLFCPFTSFGDVFYAMSYLPAYLEKRELKKASIFVRNKSCMQVASLFFDREITVLQRNDMDEMIQAFIYDQRADCILAHNDKPYFIHISKALNIKKIPFEKLYCCGVYGLPHDTEPYRPHLIHRYSGKEKIREGNTVVLSPYANSVVSIDEKIWFDLIRNYKKKGYLVYTNVGPGQDPLPGTEPISPGLDQLQDLVERAGHFVGLRSGICDVLKYADCKKTAFYPDYLFGRTKWKSIDIFALEGWENIEI